MPGPSNLTIRIFQPGDAEPLTTLLRTALANGEQNGHTSVDIEGLTGSFPIIRNLLIAELDDIPVGLISPDHHLVQVDPKARRRGVGRALVECAEAAVQASGDGPLILFPPHDNEGAIAFLDHLGYEYDHSLWRFLFASGDAEQLTELPDGLFARHYDDSLLSAYVELINESFVDHPTPLRVTTEQIQHVHASPLFNPESIAIIEHSHGDLIGFCTTSVHRDNDPPSGEIRLVGVRQDYRRNGLGRWLLCWGIQYLRSSGIVSIELIIEGQNERALELYRSVGFEPVEEWPQWTRKRGSRLAGCGQTS